MNVKNKMLHLLETRWGWVYRQRENSSIQDKNYQFIKGSIRKRPDYDEAWLMALAMESGIAFDIGCHTGESSRLILHPGSVEQIVLVDPNPTALTVAAENLIRNQWSLKARFVCAFAGDKMKEEGKSFTVGIGESGSIYEMYTRTASANGASITTPTVTIDWLVDYYNLVPDLVKVDVEGAEFLVLKGSVELTTQQKTRFLVEMHSTEQLPMRQNATRILEWCFQNDYKPWYLKVKVELTHPEQIESRGRCHLLLLPMEMPFPTELAHLEQGAPLEKVYMVPRSRGIQ